MCQLSAIEGKTEFAVDTASGRTNATLTKLPFNFTELALELELELETELGL